MKKRYDSRSYKVCKLTFSFMDTIPIIITVFAIVLGVYGIIEMFIKQY